MRLSCKKILWIVALVASISCGVLGVASGDVWAAESPEDVCYRVKYQVETGNATNNAYNPAHDGGTTPIKEKETLETNRVCRNADGTLYAEKTSDNVSLAVPNKENTVCLIKDGKTASCVDVEEYAGNMSGILTILAKNSGLDVGNGILLGGDQLGRRGDAWNGTSQALLLSDEELNKLTLGVDGAPENANDDGEEENGEGEKTCASSGAGGALGWILCPILENVSGAANDIYNEYVEPSLEVKAELFSGGDDGTRAAWEMFRNIANVAFIILLLVVIFSQLTGYGIDNYGIKKILPKLIVGVLLMNMSYLICVLCVDLSNILGGGLKDMFDGMAVDIGQTNIVGADGSSVTYAGSAGRSFLSLGLLGLLGAGGTAAVIFNPAILLSLLVAAIGIGISIFFLFLLLSARQAAVVVLTVISPLAFAAFMLPNTKKYYDKWLKFMQVMLLVYPIAGLLVGGGNFVSRLLVSAAEPDVSFMTALTAMLVGVVPILFIPSVIKGSFAAFGSAGRALSGFGKQASGRATKALQGSEGYKNAQKMGLDRRVRMKAGIDKNGNLTAAGRAKSRFAQTGFGRLIGSNKRLNMYTAAAQKNLQSGVEADAAQMAALSVSEIPRAAGIDIDSSTGNSSLGSAFNNGTKGAYYGGRFLRAANSGNISGMEAAIQSMKSAGMKSKDISKLVRHAYNTGAVKLDSNTRRDFSNKLAGKFGDTFATDYELNHFLQSGGTGVLGDYGDRFKSDEIKHDEMKPEDYMRMSGDSLAAAATTGYLTQGMAQQVRARNPNLSEDKQIMIGAVADRRANITDDTSYSDFKRDAETLMTDHGASVESINTDGESAWADRWVAPAPMRVEHAPSAPGGPSGGPGGGSSGGPSGGP